MSGRRRPLLRRALMGMSAVAAILLLALVFTTSGCASFGGTPSGTRLQRMKAFPRYADRAFHNAEPTGLMSSGNGVKVMREFFFGNGKMLAPTCRLPLFPGTAERLNTAPSSGLRITWLGHSTSIIEIDGKTVLTDPMWSERASPSTLAGPRRFHPPPLPFEQLPKIDAVIISHDHYDHLDMPTVRKLAARGVEFHVGLGVGAHLERWGVPAAQIIEHGWWEKKVLPGGVELVSVPSRHFSGRGLLDRNHTLWTSWALVGPTHRVYFSGDTGPTADFSTIAAAVGPLDVAMIEIGQWNASWGDIHLGPRGALDAFAALKAKRLLPIHWSTFQLGLHDWSEPAETVFVEGQQRGFQVLTPMLGEPIEPTREPLPNPWWRALPPMAAACPPGTSLP